MITDIPFTEYNERKKRNLSPQNFRPALHIVTKGVSGEDACTAAGCVCVCAQRCGAVRVGGWHGSVRGLQSSVSCARPLPLLPKSSSLHLGRTMPEVIVTGCLHKDFRISARVPFPIHSASIDRWEFLWPPRRKCPIFTFYVRTQERALSPPPFSAHPHSRAKTNREISLGTVRNGNAGGCARECPRRFCSTPGPARPCPCSQQPLGPRGTKRQQIALTHQ